MPVTLPQGSSRSGEPLARSRRDLARETLVALGLSEIQTYSFVSPKTVDQIRVAAGEEERKMVQILNPLGEENSAMRTVLLPNLLEALARNSARSIPTAALFELGNTFFNVPGADGLPQERESLSIGLYGPETDFFCLKGIVEELLSKLGLREVLWKTETGCSTYHPGRCAVLSVAGETLGRIGQLHPDVAEGYGLEQRVYCGELAFGRIAALADLEKSYKPLPKYPATFRDIALLVDRQVCVGDLEAVIRSQGGSLLEQVALFDVYTGKQVPEGKKSTAFTLTYRAADRTLTDEEVLRVHEKVLQALAEQCGASLREL